jgi:peptidoglycan pentaglycine glycine transferase (the first glycine)
MTMTEQVTTFSDENERKRWNTFVADSPWGHLLQSCEWGDFKAAQGWLVRRIGIERDGQIVAGAQLLFKPLPWLPLTIAYISKGPIVDLSDEATSNTLFSAIHRVARDQRAIFLKIEPNLLDDDHTHTLLRKYGFQPTVYTNQPRSTIVIDLTEGEKALLANTRKNTRKHIRYAARAGVEIVEGGASDLDSLHQMMTTAAERKGHTIHDVGFFQQEWQTFQAAGCAKLLLAKYRGQVVAVKMIIVFGDRSMHLWGGVSHQGREVCASYLIQWEAIRWAMAQGYKCCDLWGIPDQVGEMLKVGQEIPKDRHDGLWGAYVFKRGFGGRVEYYVGAYDYPYWPALYWLGMKILVRNRSVAQMSRWLEEIFGGQGASEMPKENG